MPNEAPVSPTFTRPYITTIFDRIGTCALCGADLLYVASSVSKNPDGPADFQETLATVYEYNRRIGHVLPKPRFHADDTVAIQTMAKRYFHSKSL